MPQNDEIGRMTDEVIQDITNKGVGFHRAFSWAAHRRNIYSYKERDQYNYFFTKVQERFKARDRQKLKKSLQGPRPWQHGKIVRTLYPKGRLPGRIKPGIRTELPNSHISFSHPDGDYWYPDNLGYLHHPNARYLQEAPS